MVLIATAVFGLHLLLGGSAQAITVRDLQAMALYIVAVALGGAFVGLLRPSPKRRFSVYFAMAGAGAITMNLIALFEPGVEPPTMVAVMAFSGIGALLGMAGAYGFLREP
jgi:hypothetical protein